MNTIYQALYILDIQGKEEGVKEAIDQIEAEVKAVGGKVKATRKMERKKFEAIAGKLDAGYYLGLDIELDPSKLVLLQQKLKLNAMIYRQFYLKTEDSPSAKPRKTPATVNA